MKRKQKTCKLCPRLLMGSEMLGKVCNSCLEKLANTSMEAK